MSVRTFGIEMPSIFMLYRSTVGKKIIMAVTGLVYIGYVVLHMYGNLKIFGGRIYFNEYAEGLRELGHPVFGHTHLLVIARTVLTVAIVLHVWAAIGLWRKANRARPQSYAQKQVVRANYASLTMRYGGTVIALFILYHLAHLTWGFAHADYVRGDPYTNIVTAFQFWPVTLIYLIALLALALHLYHGTWSMFQTLGLSSQRLSPWLRGLALVLAVVVPIGFAVVPLSVLLGIVQPV